jgi:prephenate dehydrogenase
MKIAVLGAGRMGGWFAKMLSQNNKVCIYDINQSRAERIRSVKVLNKYPELQGFKPDIFINAVSLENTIEVFESASPYLPDDCIISDVASVKGKIPDYYRKQTYRFVSVHPMFGPTFANVDKINEENVIIIKESDREGAHFFQNFFSNLGLSIYEYSFEQHDQMIAYSLTIPFASTMVFASCMNNTAVPGTTFKKHLEIAKGLLSEDDYLLSEILFSSYSLPQLEKVTSRLDFLKHVIRGKDFDEAKKFFDRLRKNVQ